LSRFVPVRPLGHPTRRLLLLQLLPLHLRLLRNLPSLPLNQDSGASARVFTLPSAALLQSLLRVAGGMQGSWELADQQSYLQASPLALLALLRAVSRAHRVSCSARTSWRRAAAQPQRSAILVGTCQWWPSASQWHWQGARRRQSRSLGQAVAVAAPAACARASRAAGLVAGAAAPEAPALLGLGGAPRRARCAAAPGCRGW
jgi:hypothetical protein